MKMLIGDDTNKNILEVPLKQWNDQPGTNLKFYDFIISPVLMIIMYIKYRRH